MGSSISLCEADLLRPQSGVQEDVLFNKLVSFPPGGRVFGWRADHLARRRQRLLADHIRRYRRPPAAGGGPIVRTRTAGLDFDRPGAGRGRDDVRRRRLHRVHGARPAARADTYPRRQVGNKMYEGQSSFLPLKLNTAGVIPPIFASSLLLLPTTAANFARGLRVRASSRRSRRCSVAAARSISFSISV